MLLHKTNYRIYFRFFYIKNVYYSTKTKTQTKTSHFSFKLQYIKCITILVEKYEVYGMQNIFI